MVFLTEPSRRIEFALSYIRLMWKSVISLTSPYRRKHALHYSLCLAIVLIETLSAKVVLTTTHISPKNRVVRKVFLLLCCSYIIVKLVHNIIARNPENECISVSFTDVFLYSFSSHVFLMVTLAHLLNCRSLLDATTKWRLLAYRKLDVKLYTSKH